MKSRHFAPALLAAAIGFPLAAQARAPEPPTAAGGVRIVAIDDKPSAKAPAGSPEQRTAAVGGAPIVGPVNIVVHLRRAVSSLSYHAEPHASVGSIIGVRRADLR